MKRKCRKGKTITKRNFAKHSMKKKRANKMWISYREKLKTREPQAVDERFAGGAFGCPGEYFRGAAVLACECGFREWCEECWNRPYGEEEWIPYEKRNA